MLQMLSEMSSTHVLLQTLRVLRTGWLADKILDRLAILILKGEYEIRALFT